jgi:hypothetical protein
MVSRYKGHQVERFKRQWCGVLRNSVISTESWPDGSGQWSSGTSSKTNGRVSAYKSMKATSEVHF